MGRWPSGRNRRRAGALAAERRGRNACMPGDVRDDECDIVEVAPAPVLARLQRVDDRVLRRMLVRGRVAVRGAVAAADVPAGEADAEVQPLAAAAQAIFAAVDLGRQLAQLDLVEVRTDAHCSRSLRAPGTIAFTLAAREPRATQVRRDATAAAMLSPYCVR